MKRIPPSERIRKQINEILQGDWENEEDLITKLLHLGTQRIAQEALEQEVTDHLGRGHYERRRTEQENSGYRNGYRQAAMDTAEGRIQLQVPQVRESAEPYRSKLVEFLRGNSDVLERLAVEMYTRGLSTRDIEAAFQEVTGDMLLSRTAVSTLTDVLWADYEAFCERDLSCFQIEYLFLDGVYESLRRLAGVKEGVLVAWGICRDGQKVLLHMALGSKESYSAWQSLIRDMQGRGLPEPVLIATDGAPGLIRAVEEAWPKSLRQRCLAHKLRNVIDKVPDQAKAEVKAMVKSAYYAPNREVAEMIAGDLLERFQELYPSAMKAFMEDMEACWAYLQCPTIHHRRIRTTNLLERVFVEQKRRTKVIPGFWTEKSCLPVLADRPGKLVFATLWQTSQRWRGVRMSEFEQRQLLQLRRELHLEPPPSEGQVFKRAA
jgi:putative transposase